MKIEKHIHKGKRYLKDQKYNHKLIRGQKRQSPYLLSPEKLEELADEVILSYWLNPRTRGYANLANHLKLQLSFDNPFVALISLFMIIASCGKTVACSEFKMDDIDGAIGKIPNESLRAEIGDVYLNIDENIKCRMQQHVFGQNQYPRGDTNTCPAKSSINHRQTNGAPKSRKASHLVSTGQTKNLYRQVDDQRYVCDSTIKNEQYSYFFKEKCNIDFMWTEKEEEVCAKLLQKKEVIVEEVDGSDIFIRTVGAMGSTRVGDNGEIFCRVPEVPKKNQGRKDREALLTNHYIARTRMHELGHVTIYSML